MPSYKLYYFNGRGAAEVSRIMFAQAGVQYEDIRFQSEDWPKHKAETPFGRVPVLEVDGTKIAGSTNILRYLGITFGMNGSSELDNAVLGGASDFISDIVADMYKAIFAKENEKAEKMAEFKEKTVPQMFKVLQKSIKNGHIIGSEKLSWVDIQAYVVADAVATVFGINLTDYPELLKLHDEVAAQPNIKKWLETRPKSDF